ncbi:MAG: DNA mismatch repair endonuclease MutL [Anaerovoracaceae bacterium]
MINILDKQIADKIAAGEVIERPVSIIKELVENSIDAGADSIVVEIRKGGKSYIRVSDNGCGMSAEDAEKAFLRHATSKISTAADLDAIETLGFRGEALASVCAVTRTELLTKRKEDKTGTNLILHGGQVISRQPAGCPDGTTLIITDLFYNTPARLKFMKSDSAESSLIIELISQMALAYKDISFRLINNDNVLFATTGDGNRLNIISRVFPNIDVKNLVPVEHEENGLLLDGYISTPAVSRSGRNGQIFFVNGRVVNSKVMERGVSDGYKERLFEGRYPIAFLFLEVDSSELDVNIHPNKREVRFDREKEVAEFISRAVKNSLGTKEAVVRAANIFKDTSGVLSNVSLSGASSVKEPLEKREQNKNQSKSQEEKKEPGEKQSGEQIDIKNIMSTSSENNAPAEGIAVKKVFHDEPIETPPEDMFLEDDFIKDGGFREPIAIQPPAIKPFDFDSLTVTGVIFNTYITAVDEDFYLFDQHAAHERIFTKSWSQSTQGRKAHSADSAAHSDKRFHGSEATRRDGSLR